MACPVCKRAKCRWIDLKENPSKVPTEEMKRVVDHNLGWIDMAFRDASSAYAEERAYARLTPYVEELEKRGER